MQCFRIFTVSNVSKIISHLRPSVSKHSRVICSAASRCYSTEPALSVPPADDEPKVYPKKIVNIVAEISQLTLLEVAELNELLKKTLNISDAPIMAMGALPTAVPVQEEEEVTEPVREQTSFTVRLVSFDEAKKVAVIKHIKTVMEGLNLVQAKKFVESLPAVIRADIPKDEAEKLKQGLEAAGGTCAIE